MNIRVRCSVWGRSWKNKKKRFPQWRWNNYGDENGLKTQKEAREHIMNLFETNKWEEGVVYSCVGLQANAPVGAWRVTSRRYGGVPSLLRGLGVDSTTPDYYFFPKRK